MDLSNKNIVHVKKEGIEYLQFRKLLEFDNLINCYTLSANNVDFKKNISEKQTNISESLEKSYTSLCEALKINPKQ